MKIYTRTGDSGNTGLFGGPRVWKDDDRIEAYGTVDELNAAIGVARSAGVTRSAGANRSEALPSTDFFEELDKQLETIQHELFSLGAELATPDPDQHDLRVIGHAHIDRLESWIDRHESGIPELKHFILPAGHPASVALHVARGIGRRAERRVVSLMRQGEADVSEELVMYLNRLSDLLFVMTRVVNHRAEYPEVQWVRPSV